MNYLEVLATIYVFMNSAYLLSAFYRDGKLMERHNLVKSFETEKRTYQDNLEDARNRTDHYKARYMDTLRANIELENKIESARRAALSSPATETKE